MHINIFQNKSEHFLNRKINREIDKIFRRIDKAARRGRFSCKYKDIPVLHLYDDPFVILHEDRFRDPNNMTRFYRELVTRLQTHCITWSMKRHVHSHVTFSYVTVQISWETTP